MHLRRAATYCLLALAGCSTVSAVKSIVGIGSSDDASPNWRADNHFHPPAMLPHDPARPPRYDRAVEDENNPPNTITVFGEADKKSQPVLATATDLRRHTEPQENATDADIAVDPACKLLAFASTRSGDHPAIFIQPIAGGAVTQLTTGEADDAFPTFSPDGRSIAFASNRSGTWDIYTMNLDGRNLKQITSGPAQDLHPSFSPDGGRLAYCSMIAAKNTKAGAWEIWTANLNTGDKKSVGPGLFPVWSPDISHDRIAFQKARVRSSRWFSVWTVDLVDNEPTQLTEVAYSKNAAVVTPSFSPDGQRLAFSTIVDPAQSHAGKPTGEQDVWVINTDGTNRTRLTDGAGSAATPFWAKNNRIYFTSDRPEAGPPTNSECVWSLPADNQGDMVRAKSATPALGSADTNEITH